MIIERLALRNFGCLGDAEFEFSSGLNIVRGPNEAGKSTLQAALLALLFVKATTTSSEWQRLQSWGTTQMYGLSAEFLAAGVRWRLIKDFAAKTALLTDLDTGDELTDQDQVQQKLAELLGTGSRDVYESTAAIRQQQVAALGATDQIGDMLQQAISGTAAGVSVPDILDRLDRALGDLRRGLDRPAPRNPGGLRVVADKIGKLATQLGELQVRGQQVTEAGQRLQETGQELDELAPRIEQTASLLQRAEQRRELEEQLTSVESAWSALHQRVEDAERLQVEMEKLTGELDGLPEVTAQEAERVEQLSAATKRAAGDIQIHEQRLEQLRLQLDEASGRTAAQTGGIPADETVENALNLQQAAAEAQEDVRRLEQDRNSIDQRIQVSTRQGYTRLIKVIAGLLLGVGGGLAAALLSPWWLFLTAAGVVLILSGLVGRAPQTVAELLVEREQIEAQLRTAYQELPTAQQELQVLLDTTGAETVANLNSMLSAAVREIDELKASIKASEESRERARREHAQSEQELAQVLLDRFQQPDELLHAYNERVELDNKLQRSQAQLAGVLGSDELDQMREQLGRLAMNRATIQQQLQSPELAHLDLDAMKTEELRQQLERDEQRREDLEDERKDTSFTINHADYHSEEELRVQEQLDAAQEQQSRLGQKEAAYQLTEEVLSEAYQETLGRTTQAIEPRMAELLGAITGGRYGTVRVADETFEPVVFSPEKNDEAESTDLSCATREQLYLAARLVLTEMLWPGEGPPLLLDDPLVNFDTQRDAATLALLAQFAQTRQILFFTCSPRFDQYVEQVIGLPGPG